MIDFACKQFNINEIIKCALNLKKSEFTILEFFLKNQKKEFTSFEIAKELNLNLTTIQKGVKKLYEKNIIQRHQKNLDKGGYIYTYECSNKKEVKEILKSIIKKWSDNVEKKLDKI